jgi:hypothetical protein
VIISPHASGHSTALHNDARQLTAAGLISGAGADAAEVLAASKNGYKWEASIGADMKDIEQVPRGRSVNVNGRTIPGPVCVARRARLNEISLLALGADSETVVEIAARKAGNNMAKKNAKRTGTAAVLNPAADEFDDVTAAALAAGAAVEIENADDEEDEDEPRGVSKADQRERRRIAAMQAMFTGDPVKTAKAIEDGWDVATAEIVARAADLRANMPNAMQIRTGRAKDAPATEQVIEAAVCRTGGLSAEFLEDNGYSAQVINAAESREFRGMGLQQMLLLAARANGYTGTNVKSDLRGVMQAAFRVQAAQFSTISLPTILSNAANKFLTAGFMAVDQSWRDIASRRPLSDFKPAVVVRLTGNATFEEVPADGEIKHGTLGESEFQNQLRTYAKMYGITRQDIVNDDLGALTAIQQKLGRGGALKLNQVFWAQFLDDSAFFTSDNGNLLSGGTTPLGLTGLTLGMTKFRRQTDPDGELLALTPAILLVPPELEATALQLIGASSIVTSGGTDQASLPNANPFFGKLKVVVSPYLTAASVWYLLAAPGELGAMEVGFLNGRDVPVIESSDADFNVLGILLRGYWDLGCTKAEPRAALKVTGHS